MGGKLKTVSQMVVVFCILFYIVLADGNILQKIPLNVLMSWHMGIFFFMSIVVGMTVSSGIDCFWKNRELFRGA